MSESDHTARGRGGNALPGMAPWGVDGGGSGTGPAVRSSCLSVADIEGAQPGRAFRQPRNVPQVPPDPGMAPTRQTRERSAPQPDPLTVSDIPGATAGHSDRLRPRAQPFNPLEPTYQWLPLREEPAPVPKFVRDTLDVLDIVGRKEEPATQHSARGLPGTLRTEDIEGARPGWRHRPLFVEQPRDPLRVSDITGPQPGPKERQQQRRLEAGSAGGAAGDSLDAMLSSSATSAPFGRSLGPQQGYCLPGDASSSSTPLPPCGTGAGVAVVAAAAAEPPPEHGVAFTVDWQKQRLGAKLQQAETARQARAAADAAIAAAAAATAARQAGGQQLSRQLSNGSPAAQGSGSTGDGSSSCSSSSCAGSSGAGGLAGLMRSLRVYDRDRTGRVQAAELATALVQRSGLPLSQDEVAQLVSSVQDPHGSVEYRPFVSKLWGKLQGAVPANGSLAGAAADGCSGGAAGRAVPAAAGPAGQHMPQFVAARQRRLQTHVALALNQQPDSLAAEAAEVAQLPTALPWRLPATKPFSKKVFERPEEFAGGGLPFCGGDPKAAEAAAQWRASKNPEHAWAMRKQNRPSKGAAGAPGGGNSLPSTPPEGASKMDSSARARIPPAGCPKSAALIHREAGSPLLAAERAAKAAARQEAALVQSLE